MSVAVHSRVDDVRQLLQRVDYRLAESVADREEIYRLRYRAYLREGAVLPSASEMVTDAHDNAPNSFIFGVYVEGELCSSIRISILSNVRRSSPSFDVFPDVLGPLLDAGQTIVDPTRFVAELEQSRRHPKLPLVTVRLAILACEHFGADLGLATVRTEHQPFYRRYFLNETIANPREFPGLLKPVGLVGAPCREIRDRLYGRLPFLCSSAFERRVLFKDAAARLSPGMGVAA
jgi:N-acyl-L-homoserine lactone synthetase